MEIDLDKISDVFDVQGQRSRSPGQKRDFWQFNLGVLGTITVPGTL